MRRERLQSPSLRPSPGSLPRTGGSTRPRSDGRHSCLPGSCSSLSSWPDQHGDGLTFRVARLPLPRSVSTRSPRWAGRARRALPSTTGLRSLEYLTGAGRSIAEVAAAGPELSLWLGGLALGGTARVGVYSLATRLYPNRFGAFNCGRGLPAVRAYRLLERARDLRSDRRRTRVRGHCLGEWVCCARCPYGNRTRARSRRRCTSPSAAAPQRLALACGLVAMLALSPRRLRLLVGGYARARALPRPSGAPLVASRSAALDASVRCPLDAAAHRRGTRLALELVLLVAAQASVAAAIPTSYGCRASRSVWW